MLKYFSYFENAELSREINLQDFIMVNSKERNHKADKFSMEDNITCYNCKEQVLVVLSFTFQIIRLFS